MSRDETQRYPQSWVDVEAQFPGSSAAFDRDLGDRWLDGRDGPRFDVYGPVLKVFVGDSHELDHEGPWASAYFDAEHERWIVTADERGVDHILWRDALGREGRLELVRGQTYLIGRSSDCAIRTDDAMVSRRHAKVDWRDGVLTIEDLGSAGGIHRNDARVHATTPEHGDVVKCGSLWLRFVASRPR